MGLLVILALLAMPLLLVGFLTKWGGRAPSFAGSDEVVPKFDSSLGTSVQGLGREMTAVNRDSPDEIVK
ncbi:MAG TPA: hypothetical protein VGZ02_11330 [Candidatus Baltobacteraceae bacterium]|jgi:hypothetical protein|nr:hypothetical protein [Candidatus Baltobacteraceae bacterium]